MEFSKKSKTRLRKKIVPSRFPSTSEYSEYLKICHQPRFITKKILISKYVPAIYFSPLQAVRWWSPPPVSPCSCYSSKRLSPHQRLFLSTSQAFSPSEVAWLSCTAPSGDLPLNLQKLNLEWIGEVLIIKKRLLL